MRKVSVMASGTTGKQVWILQDDVPWLVTYLAEEMGLGGVSREEEEEQCPAVAGATRPTLVPNCRVPYLHLQLTYNLRAPDAYVATFVGGPLDSKVTSSKISALTEDKWKLIGGEGPRWRLGSGESTGSDFAGAQWEEKARATAYFLERYCASLLHQASGGGIVDDPIAAVAKEEV